MTDQERIERLEKCAEVSKMRQKAQCESEDVIRRSVRRLEVEMSIQRIAISILGIALIIHVLFT